MVVGRVVDSKGGKPACLAGLLPRSSFLRILFRPPEGAVLPPLVDACLQNQGRPLSICREICQVVVARPRGQRPCSGAVNRHTCLWNSNMSLVGMQIASSSSCKLEICCQSSRTTVLGMGTCRCPIMTVRAEGCKGLSMVMPTWNRRVRRQVCKARLVKRYCLAKHLALHSRQQVSQDSSRMEC